MNSIATDDEEMFFDAFTQAAEEDSEVDFALDAQSEAIVEMDSADE